MEALEQIKAFADNLNKLLAKLEELKLVQQTLIYAKNTDLGEEGHLALVGKNGIVTDVGHYFDMMFQKKINDLINKNELGIAEIKKDLWVMMAPIMFNKNKI